MTALPPPIPDLFLSWPPLPNFLKEWSTPSASTSSPPTHSLTPCNLASRPRQLFSPRSSGMSSSPSLRFSAAHFPGSVLQLHCGALLPLELLFLGLCTLLGHFYLSSLASCSSWLFFLSALPYSGCSPKACRLAGQHILPEWLLCGFLFLHPSMRRAHHLHCFNCHLCANDILAGGTQGRPVNREAWHGDRASVRGHEQ